MRAALGLICLLAFAARPAVAGAAQEALSAAEIDQMTAELAAQLRCPVCRNQSVLESSSGLAREMQSVIRDRLSAGETPDEVKAYFVSRYGDWILLRPEPKGINLVVYLLPAAALLAGAGLLVRQIRRWASSETDLEATVAETQTAVSQATAEANVAPASQTEADLSRKALSEEDEEWIREQIGSLR
jgi:cytochrome c-type biogenesis protein CcmH